MNMVQKTFPRIKNLMKKCIYNPNLPYIYILLVTLHTSLQPADILKQIVKTDSTQYSNQKFFVGVLEEKQKLLDEFRKEQIELTGNYKAASEKLARQIDEIKTFNIKVEDELQKNPEDDSFLKQQLILKESEQVLKDTQRTLDDNSTLVTDIVTQLHIFLEDPHFETFKKKNKLNERLYYSFDDLQSLHDHILDYEQRVVQLTDQDKSLRVEKESRKRIVTNYQEEYEKRQQDMKAFTEAMAANNLLGNQSEQEKETIKIEDHLYKYKKQLADMRLKEITYQMKSIELQLFIAKSHLDLFKKQLRAVKSAIHVSEADVTLAEEDLSKEQKTYFSHKDSLRHDRDKIVSTQKNREKELNALSKQLSIPLVSKT